MFKIIGTDQQEHGPITDDQLRQWLAEGRVNAATKVLVEGEAEWKTLGEIPAFSEALPSRAAPPAPGSTPPLLPEGKTSRLAIWSVMLGILGIFTCGVTGMVGLVLGIVARVRIASSGGQLKGSGIAIAGIGTAVLALPVSACALVFLDLSIFSLISPIIPAGVDGFIWFAALFGVWLAAWCLPALVLVLASLCVRSTDWREVKWLLRVACLPALVSGLAALKTHGQYLYGDFGIPSGHVFSKTALWAWLGGLGCAAVALVVGMGLRAIRRARSKPEAAGRR
jgi:hypothetical protein